MGYKRKKQTYTLIFANPEFEGLVVRTRKASVAQFVEITSLAEMDDKGLEELRAMLTAFAGMILDWNLEDDDDTPVPVTAEALLDMDLDFVMELIGAWTLAIGDIAAPLAGGSTSGETAEADLMASMPMEVLSPALLS